MKLYYLFPWCWICLLWFGFLMVLGNLWSYSRIGEKWTSFEEWKCVGKQNGSGWMAIRSFVFFWTEISFLIRRMSAGQEYTLGNSHAITGPTVTQSPGKAKSHARFSWDDCAYTRAQLWLTLCDPMNCSLPGSSVCGISQLRIPEWVAVPSPRGSSWPRELTRVSCVSFITGNVYCWASGKA